MVVTVYSSDVKIDAGLTRDEPIIKAIKKALRGTGRATIFASDGVNEVQFTMGPPFSFDVYHKEMEAAKVSLRNKAKPKGCAFQPAWRGPCGEPAEENCMCKEHAAVKCCVCGEPAVKECSHAMQFVCGQPLCPNCEGYTHRGPMPGFPGNETHRHRRKSD